MPRGKRLCSGRLQPADFLDRPAEAGRYTTKEQARGVALAGVVRIVRRRLRRFKEDLAEGLKL